MICLTNEIPTEALEWRNSPAIWFWCRQNTLISRAQHEAWLKKIETDPTIKMFGLMKTGRDYDACENVGVCGFTSISPVNQSAEFSLYIAPDHQNKGYGKIALKTLLEHGFLHLNFNRIWGECFDRNPAKEMFRKIGMKSEGILRQSYFRNGKFIDSEIFSILRGEFKP